MKQRIRKNKTKERLDEIDIRGKSIDNRIYRIDYHGIYHYTDIEKKKSRANRKR